MGRVLEDFSKGRRYYWIFPGGGNSGFFQGERE